MIDIGDLQQLLFTGGRAPLQRTAITGLVSRNQPLPTSFSDPLYVVLPTWNIDEYFTINDWPACHGSTLPGAGAEVLLIRDDQNLLRCVWWDSQETNFVPTGATAIQPGDLIPSAAQVRAGCLLCDGSSYPSESYPALFSAIGFIYGGSGMTFHVPDLQGRGAIGAGAGTGLSSRSLGQSGGEENHVLQSRESGVNDLGGTGIESANHTHTLNVTTGGESGHTHTSYDGRPFVLADSASSAQNWTSSSSSGHTLVVFSNDAESPSANTGGSSGHSHNVSGTTSGISADHSHTLTARTADSAHNNMQPYAVVNWFIKT